MIYNLCLFPDSISYGLGHLRRCENVAHEWKKRGTNYQVVWHMLPRPKRDDIINVVLVDSYTRPESYYQLLKSEANLLVSFQDHLTLPSCVDIVISCQYGRAAPPKTNPDQTVLFGPTYVPVNRWLLTDSMNSWGYEREQKGLVFDCDAVRRGLSQIEFSERMAQAEIILCSSGITAYEALFMNKLILLRIATEEQLYTYMNLIQNGYALPLSPYTFILAKNGKWQPSRRGNDLVDGRGANRIVRGILDRLETNPIKRGVQKEAVWSR